MIAFLIVFQIWSAIVSFVIFFGDLIFDTGVNKISPPDLYKNSTLNKFGVFVISLLIFIIAPVYYILSVGYWLCHVGRK